MTSGDWYANVKNIPSQSAGTDMVAVLNDTAALDGINVGQWYFGSHSTYKLLYLEFRTK